ncbi:site-2 protease family protein [Streptomyces sp. TRM 70361]|uniref:site-2 protease family protein n=1 Tax=Streptomyces sp. TRM 70361 TaxID=3116553 RepID=UPI002E7B496C|nr:site-2 protease family protein [Streptomyces sp. TRM 70361]MEE1938850.1 site-2 protease family protein [Streptomyces sp. TRM 70361]
MRESFSLGHVAGIRIGVNWSVLVIFAIIAFGLAEGRLPQAHPDHPRLLYWGLGLATAVVFFGSLLAHELSHAVMARRHGLEVGGIVLWLFGGVARLGGDAPNPRAELRIAGVGPLVSLLLGLGFALITWLLAVTTGITLVSEAFAWLAGINILLALFNSIPAAPLDGGRLLRAFLWWRTGDRLRAASGASRAGQFTGWLLTVLGLYQVLLGRAFGGIWLVLIGWFVLAAASAEGGQAQVRRLLAGVPVREVMSSAPVTVPPDLPVEDFLAAPPAGRRHATFPVTADGGGPVGLLTLDRARRVPPGERRSTTAGEVMAPMDRVVTAGPDESLAEVLPRMDGSEERRVLVLEEGGLVGIVSPSDISRAVNWAMSSGAPGPSGIR